MQCSLLQLTFIVCPPNTCQVPQAAPDAVAEQTRAILGLTAQLQTLTEQLTAHQQALEAAIQVRSSLQ